MVKILHLELIAFICCSTVFRIVILLSLGNKSSIISIPKKGDPTNCDNYRGISLINNGIKLISKIISKRISDYGLNHGFVRPEQFSFRNK